MTEVVLKTATIFLDKRGFVRVNYNKIVDMQPEDAEAHISAVVKLCKNQSLPFLIDTRDAQGSYSVAAMRKIARDPRIAAIRKSQAILVNSLSNRILANFYIKFQQPKNPVKVFEKEKEAIDWLNDFIVQKKEAV